MVQVLPYIPSFLEQATPQLGNIGFGIGNLIGQNQKQKRDQTLLGEIQAGQASPVQLSQIWSKLSPEARKTYEPFLASQLRMQEAEAKETSKRQTKTLEKQEKATGLLESAKELRELLKYTGSTAIPFTSSFAGESLNREALEKRNEFDTIAASAASFFRDLETKGQLPLGLYEKVIEPRLPNSKLSERENRGRINGLESLAKKYGGLEPKKSDAKADTKSAEKSDEKSSLDEFWE